MMLVRIVHGFKMRVLWERESFTAEITSAELVTTSIVLYIVLVVLEVASIARSA